MSGAAPISVWNGTGWSYRWGHRFRDAAEGAPAQWVRVGDAREVVVQVQSRRSPGSINSAADDAGSVTDAQTAAAADAAVDKDVLDRIRTDARQTGVTWNSRRQSAAEVGLDRWRTEI